MGVLTGEACARHGSSAGRHGRERYRHGIGAGTAGGEREAFWRSAARLLKELLRGFWDVFGDVSLFAQEGKASAPPLLLLAPPPLPPRPSTSTLLLACATGAFAHGPPFRIHTFAHLRHRIRRHHDAPAAGVVRPPRQALPQVLCHKRHEGVKQPQPRLQRRPQRGPRVLLCPFVSRCHDRLHELDEHVAEVVLPEGVEPLRGCCKVVGVHGRDDRGGRGVEARQQPLARQRERRQRRGQRL
eukprot:200418-Chlamydomonas_euryale.AAC.2